MITVTGKDNLGFSPKFGDIVKGQSYDIEEADFADQLFDGPTADYKPIWVREAEATAAAAAAAVTATDKNKKTPVAPAETGGL